MQKHIAILGSGGHAKVVIDALQLAVSGVCIEIFDEIQTQVGRQIAGFSVQSGYPICPYVHVAIGDNSVRNRLGLLLKAQEQVLYSVVHPKAIIAQTARVEAGCFVAANAILAPCAQLEEGCIVNHAAVVDHDCIVGAWTHIAPGVVLGGGVRIGKGCLIGAGAVILPNVSIGDNAIIGAGAVVTRPVFANQTVQGVPARVKLPS